MQIAEILNQSIELCEVIVSNLERKEMKQLKFLAPYIKKHIVRYILAIFILLAVDILNMVIPKMTGEITDGLSVGSITKDDIMQMLLSIIIAGAFIAIGRFLWRYTLFGAARSIKYELRNDLFKHLEKMSVEYYNEHKTGDLMTYFNYDVEAVRKALGPAILCAFDAIVLAIIVIIQMVFYVNLQLTLLAIIPMLFIALGEFYYGKMMEKRFKKKQEAISDFTDKVQESISGVRVIKAFVRERAELREFTKANQHTMDENMHVIKLQTIVMPLLDVVIGCSSLITLLYGGYLAMTGVITLGRFIAFNQYIGMLVWPMLAAGEGITMFSQGNASIKRIREIIEEKPEIEDIGDFNLKDDIEKFDIVSNERISKATPFTGEIKLDHLSFIHRGHTEPTLEDICLEVPAGRTLAIVGQTGNGKSTIVNLLLHLYQVQKGMIFFDGRDINDISFKELRENIAYVPQDNFLFSDTLKNNIAFGLVKDADIEEVEQVSKVACIHDNIKAFPQGYDTVVGERGVTLSGGQKQRSSIARALLKDAPILILDDALSAVDTDTERQILQNLKENRAGKTTILIAHRISTIQGADYIIVLEDGKIKEQGTHEELLSIKGTYHEMFEKQQLEEESL